MVPTVLYKQSEFSGKDKLFPARPLGMVYLVQSVDCSLLN